ncbi:MAG: hypothetical protein QNJ84_11830 [Alphaproteobacteria bacterium]|nr:hypothetical protein [Alphaproteobacteria bacterium]
MTANAARAGSVGRADPDRHPDDFYRTEAYATRALIRGLAQAGIRLDGVIVDPACGDGAILEAAAGCGVAMLGSDLVFRGVGTGGVDFLADDWRRAAGFKPPDWVIMNPPYRNGLPLRFLDKALREAKRGVAILVGFNWMAAEGKNDKPVSRQVFIEDPRLALKIPVGRMSYLPPEKDKGVKGFKDFEWLVFLQAKREPGFTQRHYTRLDGS